MWSEEEMREVEPEPVAQLNHRRSRAGGLRQELIARNLLRAPEHAHELTRARTPSVIYTPGEGTHGNFIEASYQRIAAHPEWWRRMGKVHTGRPRGVAQAQRDSNRVWRELDTATSSDALLMNVFCYPRLLTGRLLPSLLGVERGLEPVFGWRPRIPLVRKLTDTTEIDMRLGSLLVEAKLTEADFQSAPMRKLERYRDFDAVFDRALLLGGEAAVDSYQLVRGVLAVHAHEGTRFCVLCDARRPELIERWATVICAVRSYELRARLRLLTWQEIASLVPRPLSRFLREKYGIVPPG